MTICYLCIWVKHYNLRIFQITDSCYQFLKTDLLSRGKFRQTVDALAVGDCVLALCRILSSGGHSYACTTMVVSRHACWTVSYIIRVHADQVLTCISDEDEERKRGVVRAVLEIAHIHQPMACHKHFVRVFMVKSKCDAYCPVGRRSICFYAACTLVYVSNSQQRLRLDLIVDDLDP